jgi:hypothetical protein
MSRKRTDAETARHSRYYADYQPPFPLTAKLNKLTIKVDRPQLSPADIQKLQAAMQEKAKAD